MGVSFTSGFQLAVLGAILLLGCSTAEAGEDRVEKFRLGTAEIWALADSSGDRDMSVFSGADPREVAKYMPSGRAASAIMVFAVKTESDLLLIDAGLGRPEGLGAALAQAGIDPGEVTGVLLTHWHGDHIGGLIRDGARAFPRAKLYSSRAERDFWLSPEARRADPGRKANFDLARQVADLYGDDSLVFDFGDRPKPGFTALDARGHTPGHTAFLLESGGEKLLFWGDLVHAAALQFPSPNSNASYDMNPAEAAAARIKYMEKAASENLPVAGAHLPFAAVGRVEKNDAGTFAYRPGL